MIKATFSRDIIHLEIEATAPEIANAISTLRHRVEEDTNSPFLLVAISYVTTEPPEREGQGVITLTDDSLTLKNVTIMDIINLALRLEEEVLK